MLPAYHKATAFEAGNNHISLCEHNFVDIKRCDHLAIIIVLLPMINVLYCYCYFGGVLSSHPRT